MKDSQSSVMICCLKTQCVCSCACVCVCTCVHVCIYMPLHHSLSVLVFMSVSLCEIWSMWGCFHMSACTNICICSYVYLSYVCKYMWFHVSFPMCLCLCVYVCVCAFACMCHCVCIPVCVSLDLCTSTEFVYVLNDFPMSFYHVSLLSPTYLILKRPTRSKDQWEFSEP